MPGHRGRRRAADHGGELAEELVGQLARRAVDQARADLGDLAADLGIDIVVEDGRAAVVAQGDDGAALGETGARRPALRRRSCSRSADRCRTASPCR